MQRKFKLKLAKDERVNKLTAKASEFAKRINKANQFPIKDVCKRIGYFRLNASEIENHSTFFPVVPLKIINFKYVPKDDNFVFYAVSPDWSVFSSGELQEYKDVMQNGND